MTRVITIPRDKQAKSRIAIEALFLDLDRYSVVGGKYTKREITIIAVRAEV